MIESVFFLLGLLCINVGIVVAVVSAHRRLGPFSGTLYPVSPPPVAPPPPTIPHRVMDDTSRRKIDVDMYGGPALTFGCHGDHHEPRPWVGESPRPSWVVCYCGRKWWEVEACPTCGHDRIVGTP